MPDELEKTEIKATLDVDALKKGLNPSGLDPDLEIKANEYAKRSWQVDFEPVLSNLGLTQDLQLVAQIQDELFRVKYGYLEASQAKETSAKEAGLRWGLKV